jgi:signal transduction histidine kinase
MYGDYDLKFATDGREALNTALTWLPDLVLLDGMMPWRDGFTVCRHLRECPHTAEVPIIIITALDDHDSHLQGIEAGADDFISKPFNRTILRTRIRAITRLNRYRNIVAERTKFEQVVNQVSNGFLLINERDEILFANSSARHYLGLRAGNHLPSQICFREIAQTQYHCQPIKAWENWPQPAISATTRYLILPETDTARDFWLQVETLGSFATGTETALIISLTDVTAQMSAICNVSRFHALITHKLRTPLISIVSGLELLANKNLSATQAPSVIELAREGVTRLQNDINQIVKYLTAATLPNAENGCDIKVFMSLFKQVCQNLDIQIAPNPCLDEVGPTHQICLTPQVMEIILTEILGNSRKFHPQNRPDIDLVLKTLPTQEICIQISDNGRCLSPEQLAQVWQPYYQGDKYSTGEVPGMGLGLPMVAAFVWSVGGQCRLYNRPTGRGVTVELILPLRSTQE